MDTGKYYMNQGFDTEDQHGNKHAETQTEYPHTTADTEKDKEAEASPDPRDDTRSRNRVRAWVPPGRCGLFFAALAAFFFSVKNMFISYLIVTTDPFQSVAMVMLWALSCSLASLVLGRIPLPKTVQQYTWLLAGGLSASIAFSVFTISVTFINVADAITISYSSLIFVGVLGWIVLREKPHLVDFLFALVSLSGVVCIARPHFIFEASPSGGASDDVSSNDLLIGVGISLSTAFFSALTYILMRRQSQLGIHAITAAFCVTLTGVLINSAICTALMRWRVPVWDEWLFALGAGFSFFAATASTVISLSSEIPTLVNIVLTLEIAFTYLFQFVFLRVSPHWTSYIGAGLVVVACFGIALKKRPVES